MLMKLSQKEIEGLMRLIGLTRDDEINCEQCLSLVAEFAEKKLEGKSVCDSLKAVEHHLAVCSECSDEYEMLQKVLKGMDE
jgi:DNA-directed RNA polymerase subunit RPC12/RpoP